MSATQVVADASVLVAALTDADVSGQWSRPALTGRQVFAPQLGAWEVANVLRRRELASSLTAEASAAAHRDLVSLPIEWWPYRPLAERAWELRRNVSIYDATYVALAELLDVSLVTLDLRLARAPGIRCEVLTPPD